MDVSTHKSKRGVHVKGGWTTHTTYPCGRILPQSNNTHSNTIERLHKKSCKTCNTYKDFSRYTNVFGTITNNLTIEQATKKAEDYILNQDPNKMY